LTYVRYCWLCRSLRVLCWGLHGVTLIAGRRLLSGVAQHPLDLLARWVRPLGFRGGAGPTVAVLHITRNAGLAGDLAPAVAEATGRPRQAGALSASKPCALDAASQCAFGSNHHGGRVDFQRRDPERIEVCVPSLIDQRIACRGTRPGVPLRLTRPWRSRTVWTVLIAGVCTSG
jgi:hypothetical protein